MKKLEIAKKIVKKYCKIVGYEPVQVYSEKGLKIYMGYYGAYLAVQGLNDDDYDKLCAYLYSLEKWQFNNSEEDNWSSLLFSNIV